MSTYSVRPLFDAESCTWTYIVTDKDSAKAVIIDPVLEQADRDEKLLKEMGVTLAYIIETHIHADHVTAASVLKDRTGAKIIYGAANNVEGADILIGENEEIRFGKTTLKALSTPGHTNGCTSYYAEGAIFTGDALLIRGCGRTDFQEGSAHNLYKSVHDKIFTLPAETIIYPAHDYKGMVFSTVEEETSHNPRLKTGMSESDFTDIMDNLGLDHPKKIDIAVPANMKAGRLSALA